MKVGYYKIKQKEPPPPVQETPAPVSRRIIEPYVQYKTSHYDYFEHDECQDVLIIFIAAMLIILLR
jgi:hypothetical protein